MKIQSIRIKNYRSIENLVLNVDTLNDGSWTYGLIGVNEAGKSSILKALALKDQLIELSQKDFRGNNPIEIVYSLSPSENEIKSYVEIANEQEPIVNLNNIDLKRMEFTIQINRTDPGTVVSNIKVSELVNEHTTKLESLLKSSIVEALPKAVFWTAESKYLIDKPVSQSSFAASPDSISIPLKNCFSLAEIDNISEYISTLSGTTDEEHLENLLGDKVTEHIKVVWPNHPIQITFRIASDTINFHVKDDGVQGKAKTADQRSDGFKQFISFLLTLSAQNRNEELSNTILLLDEPETHLHPQAQEYLLNELIKITNNARNNVCFFATHSLFMIDKNNIGRNYKIEKKDDKTYVKSFSKSSSSYSRVAFEVYGIATSDFHNELYGQLQEREEKYTELEINTFFESKGIDKNIQYRKLKKDGSTEDYLVTLPVKIRNVIHHPENPHNSYTKLDLEKSISKMLNL
jgi:AAA15 family ATPase/GTPase